MGGSERAYSCVIRLPLFIGGEILPKVHGRLHKREGGLSVNAGARRDDISIVATPALLIVAKLLGRGVSMAE